MILAAFETLLDRIPPAWMRKLEASVLLDMFAEAFEVEPPETEPLSADEALIAFREFSAACMEAALADEEVATSYRTRLGEAGRTLGARVRDSVPVRSASAFRLARFFYRGIGIELSGEIPGEVRFGPCSFAQRYTPADCWFMSAFDEGFLSGIMNYHGTLSFTCRLTEQATCCRACYAAE